MSYLHALEKQDVKQFNLKGKDPDTGNIKTLTFDKIKKVQYYDPATKSSLSELKSQIWVGERLQKAGKDYNNKKLTPTRKKVMDKQMSEYQKRMDFLLKVKVKTGYTMNVNGIGSRGKSKGKYGSFGKISDYQAKNLTELKTKLKKDFF
jgi:hypothetical protein